MYVISDKPEVDVKSCCINANGHLFVVKMSTFSKLEPYLGHDDMAAAAMSPADGGRAEYFTDRHPQCLAAVLDYHQTGELHMPGDVCPSVFRRELRHWGLDRKHVSRCCLKRYVEFLQNESTLDEFDRTFYSNTSHSRLEPVSKWERFRRRCWLVMDDPKSSVAAKIFQAISITFVILSIFVLAASTHPVFHRPLRVEEWLDLVSEDDCWEFLYPDKPRPSKTFTLATTVQPLSSTSKVVKKREIHRDTEHDVTDTHDVSPSIDASNDGTVSSGSKPHIPVAHSTGDETVDKVRVLDISVSVNGQLMKVALADLLRSVGEEGHGDGVGDALRRSLGAYFKSYDVVLFASETELDVHNRGSRNGLGRLKRAASGAETLNESDSGNNTDDTCNRKRPKNTFVMQDWLNHLDMACIVFFTAELLVRFLLVPSRCRFLGWPSTVVDLLSVLSIYLTLVLERTDREAKYTSSYIDIVTNMQVIRVFRFFRLVKDITGFQVLLYSLRSSWRELLLLLLYILIAVSVFSCVVYFMEREYMKSIPEAGWWAIVTMTTVGYGDIVPVTVQGKLVGCVCALSGVLLIAVTVPVFVNNFLLFYGHSQMISDIDNRNEDSKPADDRDIMEKGNNRKISPENVDSAWT